MEELKEFAEHAKNTPHPKNTRAFESISSALYSNSSFRYLFIANEQFYSLLMKRFKNVVC